MTADAFKITAAKCAPLIPPHGLPSTGCSNVTGQYDSKAQSISLLALQILHIYKETYLTLCVCSPQEKVLDLEMQNQLPRAVFQPLTIM